MKDSKSNQDPICEKCKQPMPASRKNFMVCKDCEQELDSQNRSWALEKRFTI